MKKAIYAGTFDPITLGHYDLIVRASTLFDQLIVLVGQNAVKHPLFSVQERMDLIREAVVSLPNVIVDCNDGLTVEYARRHHANILVRGVRAFADFEYELQMALMNRQLADEIETIFLMPKNEYSYINSSLIKGISAFGADIGKFVPENVVMKLQEKMKKNG